MANLDSLEKNVLACLLSNVDNCKKFKERHFTEDFFQFPEPKKLFSILWYHFEKYQTILHSDDLKSYLKRSAKMSDDYKAKMEVFYTEVQLSPIASTFDVLLDEFLLYYKNYQLSQALTLATSTLADKNPDKAMELLQTSIQQLREKTTTDNVESGFFGNPNRDLFALYEKKRDHPELFRGIELGFPSLDAVVTHKPSTVTLIIGQMKSAKSVLMINIAHNLISQGKKVYLHVNEGGAELVETRLACCDTGLNMTKIDRCILTPDEEKIFKASLDKYKNSNLLFIDPVPVSLSSCAYIERKVKDLETVHGKFDVLLIDYLGLMQSNKEVEQDWLRYGAISMELKDIAAKLHIPIIVVHHVNRKGMEDKKKTFELNEIGLSLEPLKNVDVICSWRIHDTDFFELSNTGQGTLSIRGSRQSAQKSVVLEVDTSKMKIWEDLKFHTIGIPHISSPDTVVPSLEVTSSGVDAGSATF
jgi:replicative DNA helicase